MQDSELLFNTISAIAIGLVVSTTPGAVRAASDESDALYKFNKVGNAGTGGANDIQMWTVGLNCKF
jgi:hypothetical protein